MIARRCTSGIVFGAVIVCALSAGCGKKGDPLAPLRLVPVAPTELAGSRIGENVELHFIVPGSNANGAGPVDMVRVEIYAMTIAAGAVTPPNRDLLTKGNVVGTIAIRPPAVDGQESPPNAPPDKRPAAGDHANWVEQLTEEKLKPVVLAQPAKPVAPVPTPTTATPETPPAAAAGATAPGVATAPAATPATATPAGAPAVPGQPAPGTAPVAATVPAAPPPQVATYPTRIYVIRGISKGGRPGLPSARVNVPLVSPLAPPTSVVAQLPTERAVVVDWTPPVAEPGGAPLTFNVYRRDTTAPLNQAPLTEAKFELGTVEYGKEACFVVRAVQTLQNVAIESEPSAPACLTPVDKFPPAPPKGLRAVAEDGAVNLVWDASSESDLVGYVVLRAEGESGTLQPLTPKPIKDANYRDATVTAGVRYSYAVVAVDNASPPNSSAPSAHEAVTAR